MRTPWRFLSDLVGGKAGTKEQIDQASAQDLASSKLLPAPGVDLSGSEEPVLDKDEAYQAGEITTPAEPVGNVVKATDEQGELVPQPPAEQEGSEAFEADTREADPANEEEESVKSDVSSSALPPDALPLVEAHQDIAPALTNAPSKQSVKPQEPRIELPATVVAELNTPTPKTQSFADEMAELDAEIASLRIRLSEKLAIQNDQLRQLIQRYPTH